MKPTPEELKIAEELLGDGHQEDWEKKKLGKDPHHARKLSISEVEKYMGEKKGTSIRISQDLIDELKILAAQKGLSYQSYLRMVLIEHVRSKKSA